MGAEVRSCSRVTVCLAAVLCLAASSFSQQRRGNPIDRDPDSSVTAYWAFDLVVLLNEPLVRAALLLSAEQARRHDELAQGYLRSQKELFLAATETQTLPEAKRKPILDQLAHQQHQLSQDYGKRATGILTASQRTRLEQITFQLRGVDVFFMPEINKLLELDDVQRKGIDGVQVWLIQEIRRLCKADAAPAPHVEVDPRKLALQRQEAKTRIAALLRSDQLERLRWLRGEPIAFAAENLSMLLRERHGKHTGKAEHP